MVGNNNLNEIDESLSGVDPSEMSQEELKKAIGDFLSKERSDSMILGFRVACQSVLEKIAPWRQKNCSHREYERIFKKVEEFCLTALKQDEEVEETAQN